MLRSLARLALKPVTDKCRNGNIASFFHLQKQTDYERPCSFFEINGRRISLGGVKPEGVAKSYRKNGDLAAILPFRNGLPNGVGTYYENGRLKAVVHFKDGKYDDLEASFNAQGMSRTLSILESNPTVQSTVFHYDKSGQKIKMIEKEWSLGKMREFKQYDEKGQLTLYSVYHDHKETFSMKLLWSESGDLIEMREKRKEERVEKVIDREKMQKVSLDHANITEEYEKEWSLGKMRELKNSTKGVDLPRTLFVTITEKLTQ